MTAGGEPLGAGDPVAGDLGAGDLGAGEGSVLRLHGLGGSVDLELVAGGRGDEADEQLWSRVRHIWRRCAAPGSAELSGDGVDGGVVHAGTRQVAWLADAGGDPGRLAATSGAQGNEVTVASTNLDSLLVNLTRSVTQALVGASIGRMLLFHAGGVSHPDSGASLAFIAAGGTGKTTLTTTLARQFGYLSDETVAVLADGRILPYPKPLSTRVGGEHKDERSPDDLGLLPAHPRPHLTGLVLLRRDPEASGVEVSEVGLFDAIQAILPETSSLPSLPRALHVFADLIERTGAVQCWTYSEHEHLLSHVHERLGS